MSNRRLFIGNLPYDSYETEDLRSELANLGLAPTDVKVLIDRDTGRGKGFGFIEFKTEDEATKAKELLGTVDIGGRVPRIDWATERPQSGGNRGGGGGGGKSFGGGGGGGGGGRRDFGGGRGGSRGRRQDAGGSRRGGGNFEEPWRDERRSRR